MNNLIHMGRVRLNIHEYYESDPDWKPVDLHNWLTRTLTVLVNVTKLKSYLHLPLAAGWLAR